MATLNTIRNVVGNYGSNSQTAPTITFGCTANALALATAGSINKLSAGDVLTVVSGGGTAYSANQDVTVTAVNLSTRFITLSPAPGATSAAVVCTLKYRDTDPVTSVGGVGATTSNTRLSHHIGDGTPLTASGGTATVLNARTLANYTSANVMFTLEDVKTTAGVSTPSAIISLLLTNGNTGTVIANMSKGDVFYTSSMTTTIKAVADDEVTTFTQPENSGTGILLQVRNTAAVAYNVYFKCTVATA